MNDYSEELNESNQEKNTKPEKLGWYAVQVASGCEKRVKNNLEQRIKTLDVGDRIKMVQIPQMSTVKIRKDGSRQNISESLSGLCFSANEDQLG